MTKQILFFCMISTALLAQSAGNSGISFLKLGFGARNISMGDLGVTSANDISSFHYNPSLLASAKKTQLSFTHNSLFKDMNSEMFAGSFEAFGLWLAVGINTTNISGIEVRNIPGAAVAEFNAHYFNGSLSAGYELNENIFLGATYKYLYESLYSDEASGSAFDFGISYKDIIKNLSAGASIRNIGSMNELRDESSDLPTDLRVGVNYDYPLVDYKIDIAATAGFQKYTNQDDSHVHLGGEVLYDKMFALRLGYISGYDSKNITTGFGVVYKSLNLDYAYVPVKYGLGDSHIFTFTYSFQ